MKTHTVAVCVLLLGMSHRLDAQPAADTSAVEDSSMAYISFVCTDAAMVVLKDGMEFSRCPAERVPLSSGVHVLTYVPFGVRDWAIGSIQETIMVVPGEHLARTIAPVQMFTITSEPQGASVYARDSLLGATPLIVYPRQGGMLRLSRPGYADESLPITASNSRYHVLLRPMGGHTVSSHDATYLSIAEPSPAPLYVAAAVTIIAGATSAYFKIKADNEYADYQIGGDQGSLSRIRSYDTVAGISLAVSQVGLGILTYLFLTR